DHHRTQEPWGDARWVDATAAAAGEMAYRLVRDLGAPIDRPMALALFVAIASDTGWFQFNNTSPGTMRLVADLMESGIDFDRMNQLLNQNERVERLKLQQRAMNSLRIEGNVALLSLSKKDFEESNGSVRDTENLVNIPLIAREIQIAILLTEQPEGGPIRVSLRSKGQIDCSKFAEQFGGGGHARAAGLKIEGSLDEALQRILNALHQASPK
ncbi:MAG TPA: DHHA1 domain-containing protein, partial [Tepidisphaeraceae bacterium]|nr:DHHA1 domain-containing protein [Tepidisphaeraceae bacterium]